MSVFQVQISFKNRFMFKFISILYLLVISESNFRLLGVPNRGFRMEGIAKIDVSWRSFLKNFWIVLLGFVNALGAVFLIF